MFKLQNHPQGDFLTLRYEKCDIYILVYIYINLVSITWSKFNSCINVNACWGLMKLLFFILHSILPYIQIFVFKIKFTKKKKKPNFSFYIFTITSHTPHMKYYSTWLFSHVQLLSISLNSLLFLHLQKNILLLCLFFSLFL